MKFDKKQSLKADLAETERLLRIVEDKELRKELTKNLFDIEKQLRSLELEETKVLQLSIRFKRAFRVEVENEYRYPKITS